jgi:hypothetical protein
MTPEGYNTAPLVGYDVQADRVVMMAESGSDQDDRVS